MSLFSDAVPRAAEEMSLPAAETSELAVFVDSAARTAESMGIHFDADRALALTTHSVAFIRRVRENSRLPAVSGGFFAEIDDDVRVATTRLLREYTHGTDFVLRDEEVLLFAIHFQIAKSSTGR